MGGPIPGPGRWGCSVSSDPRIIERLPGDLRVLAEICGIEAALKIADRFQGTYIYIPRLDGLKREIRDQAIRDEYDKGETTAKALALKYDLSIRRIFDILGIQPGEDGNPTLPFSE